MNQTNTMLLTLGESYGFSVDTPEQEQQLKVSGMKFQIRSYYVKGLGHVSAMIASGFFGLMKMDTLIINPTEVDMPLFSYDRVLAMGNDTLIFELYDTFLGQTDMSALDGVKASAAYLPDHDLGEHWYDSIKCPKAFPRRVRRVKANPLIPPPPTIWCSIWQPPKPPPSATRRKSGRRHRYMWKAC